MKFVDSASTDDNTHGDGTIPPGTGLTPDVLPEVQVPVQAENSQTGVSTNSAHKPSAPQTIKQEKNQKHWYALRVTYGREKDIYEYLVSKNLEAYYPTLTTVKEIDGKRKTVTESRLPNIFFARGTEELIRSFVFDNINLPHLRFYYCHIHRGARIIRKPLIVPDSQIEALKIICASEAEDLILTTTDVPKFIKGQHVRVIEGKFKGVEGIVARYQGQQRVGIVINGLLTACTAYVPSAFVKKI